MMHQLRPELLRLQSAYPSYSVHVVGFSLGAGVAALVGGVLEGGLMAEHPTVAQCAGMVSSAI